MINSSKNTLSFPLAIAFCIGVVSALQGNPVKAQESDEWKYTAQAYLWVAEITGQSSSGGDVDIDFSELWDNLDMAFMGSLSAQRGKWSLLLDPVYLKESGGGGWSENIPVGPFSVPTDIKASVKLESWITNFAVGYEVMRTESSRLELMAGARYLSMDIDVQLDLTNVITTASNRVEDSESNWDGIVGVQGTTDLNDRWSFQYRADIGTGDSDFTGNVVGAVAYEFSWGQVIAGYRYLHYEFDNSNVGVLMNDLDVKGPILGAQFRF